MIIQKGFKKYPEKYQMRPVSLKSNRSILKAFSRYFLTPPPTHIHISFDHLTAVSGVGSSLTPCETCQVHLAGVPGVFSRDSAY